MMSTMPKISTSHEVRHLLIQRMRDVLVDALFDEDLSPNETIEAEDACEELAAVCLDSLFLEIVSIDGDVRASAVIELTDSPVEV